MRERYPKRRGREYYPRGACFLTDEDGNEVYAVDEAGNQLYPNRDGDVFARDRTGRPYYAKDAAGNEYYPVRKGRSLFLLDARNEIRTALAADGTQRYPADSKGNEYYWRRDDEPFLLRKGTGEAYLARSKNGNELIPWNRMREYAGDEPCIYAKDSEGNTVYVKESDFPGACKALIRCLCHVSVICPKMTQCHTRFS